MHYNPNTNDIVEWVCRYASAAITADRAARAPADSEIDRLRVALLEAEAGLIMAGADVEPSGDFVPSPTAALRIVRTALVHNA